LSPLRQGAAHFLYNKPPTDVLILLFDLGSSTPARNKRLQLATTARADTATLIYVLRSRGHTSATFDCIRSRNCETPCNPFFDVQAKETDPSEYQNDWEDPLRHVAIKSMLDAQRLSPPRQAINLGAAVVNASTSRKTR
jgi:hypothetical protein